MQYNESNVCTPQILQVLLPAFCTNAHHLLCRFNLHTRRTPLSQMVVSYRCGRVQCKNLSSVVLGRRKSTPVPKKGFHGHIPTSTPAQRLYKHFSHIILPLFYNCRARPLVPGTACEHFQSWLHDLVGFTAKPSSHSPLCQRSVNIQTLTEFSS